MPHPHLERLRTLSRTMDDLVRIPGTGIRVGLDPVLGLLPGAGDLIGAGVSLYALLVAGQVGAPLAVILRMAGNILLDTIVGGIPLLGDLFDVGWKSNRRNVRLLEKYLEAPSSTRRSSLLLVGGVMLVLAVIIAGIVWLGVDLVRWVAGQL